VKSNGATVGYEQQLWLMADALLARATQVAA
jgi:hypothetical protein